MRQSLARDGRSDSSMTNRGMLITFEGIDGSGKSSHAGRVLDYLIEQGHPVRLVREPGETVVGEKIRTILLDRTEKMTAMTELLLYEAARAELVRTIIQPALASGEIVLADRFYDSTTAYQGYGRQLDMQMIRHLNTQASDSVVPSLTLIFDLPLAESMRRRGKEPDRLESESISFFERVANGYRQIALSDPSRCKIIDSTPSADTVFMQVQREIDRCIGSRVRV